MVYTLHFGGDAPSIVFTNASYHFITQKLWLLEITDDETLIMTHQPPRPVAYRMYDAICASTIKNTHIVNNRKSTPDEKRAARTTLDQYASEIADDNDMYDNIQKKYTLTSSQRWYIVDDMVIMWRNTTNSIPSPALTSSALSQIAPCTLNARTNTVTLLGDYYYFVRGDKKEGLRRWQLAADTNCILCHIAHINVEQYSTRLEDMTDEWVDNIYVSYAIFCPRFQELCALLNFHIGNLYKDRDEEMSTGSYKLAVYSGSNVYAAYEMGNLSMDPEQKLNWYTFAATGRHPRAEYALGMLLHRERADKHAEAMTWLYRASLHGIVEADAKVADLQRGSDRNVVVVLQTTYDYNGAFTYKGFADLEHHFPNFVDKFDFVHIYIDSMPQITQRLADICQHRKIAHLVVMAHGATSAIALARDVVFDISNAETLGQLFQPHLATSSSILLHSCRVGFGGRMADNFAQALADSLPGHPVWGASDSFTRGDVTIADCAPDSTEQFLNITYDTTTSSAATIHRFIYTPSFSARTVTADVVRRGGWINAL